jgi:putative FmdB family regulatory protein
MPTYEYACKRCGEHLEVVQSFKDKALTECPACGGDLRKVFGNIGITFKGSGFYRTDSRSDGRRGTQKSADGKAGEGKAAETKSGDSSAGSSAAKSEASSSSSSGSSSGSGHERSSNRGSSAEKAAS